MKRLASIVWTALVLLSGIGSVRAGNNFSAATVLSGATATSTENNQSATVETGEAINTGSGRSLWWKWTAPDTGMASVDTAGSSSFNKILDVLVPATSATPTVSTLAWVRQYGGAGYYTPLVTFPVVGGTTYYIRVYSYNANDYGNITVSVALSNTSNLSSLTFQDKATAANDLFANRAQLTGYSPSAMGYYLSAGLEANEPSISGAYRSLWWTWTAPETGMLSIDTAGSSNGGGYGTPIIAVFTGSSLTSLRLAAAVTSFARIPVFKGTAYSICILSSLASSPNYQVAAGDTVLTLALSTESEIKGLNITSLGTSNDIFANRVKLTGSSVSSIAYSINGDREANEPSGTGYATLWWTWTATGSGTVTLDTANSSIASSVTTDIARGLSVWTGSTLASLQQVASAGSSSTAEPKLSFTASAGQTYQIAVGAYASNTQPGSVILSLSGPAATTITVPTMAIYNAVQLEWMAEKGATYQLQTSTDNANWTNSGNAIAGDGILHQINQRIDRNHLFFRVSRQ